MKIFSVILLVLLFSVSGFSQGVKGTRFKHRTCTDSASVSDTINVLSSTPVKLTIVRVTATDTLKWYYGNDTTNVKGMLVPGMLVFLTEPIYGVKIIRFKSSLGSFEYFFWAW